MTPLRWLGAATAALAVAWLVLPRTPPTPEKPPTMPAARPSFVHATRPPTTPGPGPAPMLLLLHGVGSNERDLLGLAPDLDPRLFVVSARAPHPMGPDGYAWFHFDILPDGGRLVDHDQAESSRVRLLGFIDELAAAYPVDRTRVYVAGFSQGAMMAASLALTAPSKLAGAVLMSGRILPEVLERHAGEPELRGFPVLVVHGTNDQVLPIANGRASRDALSLLPVKLAYAEFPMAHEVSRASLRTVADWLRAQLDAKR